MKIYRYHFTREKALNKYMKRRDWSPRTSLSLSPKSKTEQIKRAATFERKPRIRKAWNKYNRGESTRGKKFNRVKSVKWWHHTDVFRSISLACTFRLFFFAILYFGRKKKCAMCFFRSARPCYVRGLFCYFIILYFLFFFSTHRIFFHFGFFIDACMRNFRSDGTC